ncbi:MAG: Holliday junction branch migration protein RuvA [Clostridia bacterium]|nr:Holliday junction branch migration protein RuvA [Clostridia bacterium]
MIYSVRGTLIHRETNLAVVECGGVGYQCNITLNTARQLPQIGSEAMLFTILNVREDAAELFGFADNNELTCFKLLTGVNGVGPKAGLSILSELSPERVALAIAGGDYKALTRAQGVGPKLAQRIVLELKDKVGIPSATGGTVLDSGAPIGAANASGNAAEAASALTMLGFSAGEASAAVAKLDSALPVEELVRQALRTLGRR